MQFRGRTLKPLDVAITVTVTAVLIAAAYLGWSVWSYNRTVVGATPASRAIDELSGRLDEHPDDIGVRLQLAQALAVAGRDTEAITQYRVVLNADKNNIAALSGLGFLASQRKEWKTAEGYWRRLIEIREPLSTAPQDLNLEKAYFYLATALTEQKRWEESIPYFKAALRIKQDASDTHYLLAVAYKEVDSPQLYREELEVALAFDPLMPEANYDLGMILLNEDDVAGAAEHFRTSADAAPAAEQPQQALDGLGPYAEHIEAARRLFATDPKTALVEARVAAALEPRKTEALSLLAELYEKTGDKAKALTVWRRVAGMDAADATATAAVKRLDPDAK